MFTHLKRKTNFDVTHIMTTVAPLPHNQKVCFKTIKNVVWSRRKIVYVFALFFKFLAHYVQMTHRKKRGKIN